MMMKELDKLVRQGVMGGAGGEAGGRKLVIPFPGGGVGEEGEEETMEESQLEGHEVQELAAL